MSTQETKPLNMKEVDPAIVNRALKSLGIPTNGSPDDRLLRLQTHQHDPANVPDENGVTCSRCGGYSDDRLDACPYCGEAGTEAEPKTNGAAAAPAPTSDVEAEEDSEDDEDDADDPPESAEAPKAAAPEAPKKKRSEAVKKPAAAVKAELVQVPRSLDVSEKALDRALERVNAAHAKGAKAYWELGSAIKDIHDRKLYTQRAGVDGKPRYKSWLQFSQEELKMSDQHASRAMNVAAAFSKDDFEKIGVSKLSLIAKLPDDMQAEIIEKARAGLPLADVERQVRKLNPRATGSKKPAAPSKPPKAPGPDELTAVVTKDKIKVPMFARAKKKDAKPVRAMTLGQDPSGEYELPNGVVMHVHIIKEARGLVVHIEHRRKASDED